MEGSKVVFCERELHVEQVDQPSAWCPVRIRILYKRMCREPSPRVLTKLGVSFDWGKKLWKGKDGSKTVARFSETLMKQF